MSSIKISTVKSQKDLMRFIKFQWKIYQGDKFLIKEKIHSSNIPKQNIF